LQQPAFLLTGIFAAALYFSPPLQLPWSGFISDGWDAAESDDEVIMDAAPGPAEEPGPTKPRFRSAARLEQMFQRLGYDLETVRESGTVPRVLLTSLPDFGEISATDTRKRVFFKTVLPLVLDANEAIQKDRNRILALRFKHGEGSALRDDERAWLRAMAEAYGADEGAGFDELLRRVDTIPPSLALAQGALESGWGTSRLAQQGNALFGQYAFLDDDGPAPRGRDDGKSYRLRTFDTPSDAVRAYAANLNSNPAYAEFRKLRAEMRADGRDPDGYDLAATITRYSELRKAYVRSVRRIIDAENLSRFDDALLSTQHAITIAGLDSGI
jgi:Bax protein